MAGGGGGERDKVSPRESVRGEVGGSPEPARLPPLLGVRGRGCEGVPPISSIVSVAVVGRADGVEEEEDTVVVVGVGVGCSVQEGPPPLARLNGPPPWYGLVRWRGREASARVRSEGSAEAIASTSTVGDGGPTRGGKSVKTGEEEVQEEDGVGNKSSEVPSGSKKGAEVNKTLVGEVERECGCAAGVGGLAPPAPSLLCRMVVAAVATPLAELGHEEAAHTELSWEEEEEQDRNDDAVRQDGEGKKKGSLPLFKPPPTSVEALQKDMGERSNVEGGGVESAGGGVAVLPVRRRLCGSWPPLPPPLPAPPPSGGGVRFVDSLSCRWSCGTSKEAVGGMATGRSTALSGVGNRVACTSLSEVEGSPCISFSAVDLLFVSSSSGGSSWRGPLGESERSAPSFPPLVEEKDGGGGGDA